jgi:hypothetical protein
MGAIKEEGKEWEQIRELGGLLLEQVLLHHYGTGHRGSYINTFS